jgi:hypothetical protein
MNRELVVNQSEFMKPPLICNKCGLPKRVVITVNTYKRVCFDCLSPASKLKVIDAVKKYGEKNG